MSQRLISVLAYPLHLMRKGSRWLWSLQSRERLRLSEEMSQTRGLMQLLMKQRNGYRWTDTDRKKIRVQLRKLVAISPYLALFVLPGGLLALPILAWWLDRRRQKRSAEAQKSLVE